MREIEATVADDGWVARQVHHLRLGLTWQVLEILELWTHPGWPRKTCQKPVVERRHRLRVLGPVPGGPGRDGEFMMIATSYGDRPRWWIKPDESPQLLAKALR